MRLPETGAAGFAKTLFPAESNSPAANLQTAAIVTAGAVNRKNGAAGGWYCNRAASSPTVGANHALPISGSLCYGGGRGLSPFPRVSDSLPESGLQAILWRKLICQSG
jgi:hypothetical protein